MNIKITYNKEVKKTKWPANYATLLAYVKKSFGDHAEMKLCYVDPEGDVISISNDDDLEGMLECNQQADS